MYHLSEEPGRISATIKAEDVEVVSLLIVTVDEVVARQHTVDLTLGKIKNPNKRLSGRLALVIMELTFLVSIKHLIDLHNIGV